MRKVRRWWQRQLYTNREVYSGSSVLADWNFQSVSGLYKNLTRMSSSEFVQERLTLTLRFLASGDSYVSLQ
jgi:hypothetical protein